KEQAWQTRALSPFGLEVTPAAPAPEAEDVGAPLLRSWIAQHRYVLLRGFAPFTTESMMRFAQALGAPLEWEFGAVNELVAKPDARNYIYTTGAVPFHW